MYPLQIRMLQRCAERGNKLCAALESRRAQCTIYKSHCKKEALDVTETRNEQQPIASNAFLVFDVEMSYAAEYTSNHMKLTQQQALRVKSQKYAPMCTLARIRWL